MGLSFNPADLSSDNVASTQVVETSVLGGIDLPKTDTAATPTVMTETQVADFTQNYKQQLRQLPEVEALTSEIQVDDPNSILVFGQAASQGISQVSDNLLSTMKQVRAEEAGEMLQALAKVMDKFDVKELENIKEPTGLQKLFNKAKNSVEALFAKYENMGSEVDKIYTVLTRYEKEIEVSNQNLKTMYDTNINYYQTLEKYIVAGEMGLEELDTKLIPEYQAKADAGDRLALTTVQSLQTTREMLAQRVYDLQIAENIALQTIPMIQGIQYSNFNLTRKINSAFIITLPIFKQCLAQAVMLKRQELQAKSLKALDDKTNELLLRNAQNMVTQTTSIAKMAGSSSVQVETLEKTWTTIMSGIEETKRIEEENKKQRIENSKKLENIKANMLSNRR